MVALKNTIPQQIPGDHFNTEQATSDGSSIATAVPGTASIGTGLSIDADAAVADRRNQIPVLPGTSSGSSSAGSPPPSASGTSAQAVANIPPRATGNNKFSAVAGYPGANQNTLTSPDRFMRQIVWDEGGDRPCYLEIWDSDSVDDKIETACAKDMNPFSDLSLRVSSMPSVSLDGDDRIIGRLEVCNNNNANRRLKGMRIWGDRVLEDGSIQYEPNSSSKALPNCATWSSSVMCPTDTYATGVVVHSADKGDITGLQLVCRAVLKN